MTDCLDQVRHQLDQAQQQLRAAEDELAMRRQREALALAVLNGWGPAGHEAEQMRHEIREALAAPAMVGQPSTDRPSASTITDEQLDALYAELDQQPRTNAGALMAQVQQLGGQLKAAQADRDSYREKLAAAERINAAQMARLGNLADIEDRLHAAEERIAAVRGVLADPLLHTRDPERHGERWLAGRIRAALEGPNETRAEQRVVDTCHTVTVDGETIRVRGAGPLGPVGELALAEVIRAAKRKYAAEHPEAP